MTLARSPRTTESLSSWLFLVAAAVACGMVLMLSAGLNFWHDECDFLHHRSLSEPLGLFTPHNHHPVALPAAVYRMMVENLGTAAYAPYLAILLVLHVFTAAGLYLLLRRERLWTALAAACVLLFLGTGGDNLFWAFQITFVGATALGVWGFWAADRGRYRLAAGLFTGAVFCSLTGVAFLVGGMAVAAYRADRRGLLLVAPAAILGLWWIVFARDWVRPPDWAFYETGSPTSLASWAAVPGYVLSSVFEVVGAISGLGVPGALAIVALGAAAAMSAWSRGWRPSAIHVAAIAGFFSFMTMVAVVRAGEADALRPRFVYVGAVFALMLVPRIPRHLVWFAAAFVLFAIALGTNMLAMVASAAMWTARAAGPLACTP